MKKIVYLLFTIVSLGILGCGYFSSSPKDTHKSALPKGFDTLSRQAQVMVCASCHQREYENEMRGPHARSHKGVEELKAYVNNKQYDCDFYKNHVNEISETACLSCHSPSNMFETMFKENGKPYTGKLPIARKDKKSFSTGVDCMTCHYDGKNVLKTSSTSESTKGCTPKFNAKLATNDGCKPCHFSNWVSDTKTYFGNVSNEVSCLSCHQQYDKNGKPTHYIYNRFSSPDSTFANLLAKFFTPKDIAVTPAGVKVIWQNNVMPHNISEGPENIIVISAYTSNNKLAATGKIYLNKKAVHDEAMLGVFNNQRLPGVIGYTPIYNETTIDTVFKFKEGMANQKKYRIEIKGLNKGQYWFNDSTAHLRYQNSFWL